MFESAHWLMWALFCLSPDMAHEFSQISTDFFDKELRVYVSVSLIYFRSGLSPARCEGYRCD
jgi:hypothetical protein